MFMHLMISGLIILSTTLLEAAPSAEDILKASDDVRNPAAAFLMLVDVKDQDGANSSFEVKTLGQNKTLIKTLSAAHSKTSALLMIDQDMWAYIPSLKRAVRVSLQQKLSGQAANGDIARMRLAGDYDVRIESEDGLNWILFLSANKKGLTYDRIRLWVSKNGFRPQKAEYLSLNSEALKTASFENYGLIAGSQRPQTIIIR
ncbi:MAG: outer membrane lipoprotein-sorting protein, partial [Proteobacteria bacterium]|nr:outer membrane lipoprotein-sorting protein [Pseudomonadota bacterium]